MLRIYKALLGTMASVVPRELADLQAVVLQVECTVGLAAAAAKQPA